MSIGKLLKATGILGLGMITESTNCVVTTAKDLKPEKFLGCYTHIPKFKVKIQLDRKNPLDLEKAQLKLTIDGVDKYFTKCLELRKIRSTKFVKWYKCETYDKYVVRFKPNTCQSKLNKLCSQYRNCIEIQDAIGHELTCVSARCYNLMKENKSFPGQENNIV